MWLGHEALLSLTWTDHCAEAVVCESPGKPSSGEVGEWPTVATVSSPALAGMPASDIYRAPPVCPALDWVRLWGDRDYSREWRLWLPLWAVPGLGHGRADILDSGERGFGKVS